MAAKPSKAKAKRQPAAKTKAKRARSKPLLAKVASVRTAIPRATPGNGSDGMHFPPNPALMMLGMMGRLMGVDVEQSARFGLCRSPMDLRVEQVQFTQRIFSECQSTALLGRSPLRG